MSDLPNLLGLAGLVGIIVWALGRERMLIGEELHDPPRTRRLQPRRKSKLAVTPEAVGVIIAPAVAQLLIAFTNALAHTAKSSIKPCVELPPPKVPI